VLGVLAVLGMLLVEPDGDVTDEPVEAAVLPVADVLLLPDIPPLVLDGLSFNARFVLPELLADVSLLGELLATLSLLEALPLAAI